MSRPIPFNHTETFFWSNTGGSPDWFTNDTAPVDTYRLPNIQLALEWMQRRRDVHRDIPRVIAPDDSGAFFFG